MRAPLSFLVPGLIGVVSTFSLAASAAAQAPAEHDHSGREQYHVEARHASRAPAIDGVLDEPIWGDAAMLDNFTQQEPNDGAPASERTEVRLLYDAEHLYIGVRAFDSSPDGIIATEMRRDSPRLLDEDNFQVILDTFRDSRSGYMFVTNPLGAKLEQQVFEEGGGNVRGAASNINRDWNGVWDAAAQRVADGWTAEIVIPMVTVRSPEVDVQTWGVNFMRNIRRKNEQVYWSPIPKPYTRDARQPGRHGVRDDGRHAGTRPAAEAVCGGWRPPRSAGRIGHEQPARRRRTGREVRTDLRPRARRHGEHRLRAGRGGRAAGQPHAVPPLLSGEARLLPRELGAVHGRQSGQPADRRISSSAAASDCRRPGSRFRILGGARMTGKMGRNNLAVMQLQTGEAFGRPGDNFLVARYSRDVGERSRVGGLFVNKEAIDDARFNRTIAADAVFAPTRSFSVHSFLARTATPGVADNQQAFQTRVLFLNNRWNNYAEFPTSRTTSTTRWGSCRAPASGRRQVHLERNPRPGGLIRVLEPMITFDLHHRSEQPPDHAPNPPHGGDAVPEWVLPQRVHGTAGSMCSISRSRCSPT